MERAKEDAVSRLGPPVDRSPRGPDPRSSRDLYEVKESEYRSSSRGRDKEYDRERPSEKYGERDREHSKDRDFRVRGHSRDKEDRYLDDRDMHLRRGYYDRDERHRKQSPARETDDRDRRDKDYRDPTQRYALQSGPQPTSMSRSSLPDMGASDYGVRNPEYQRQLPDDRYSAAGPSPSARVLPPGMRIKSRSSSSSNLPGSAMSAPEPKPLKSCLKKKAPEQPPPVVSSEGITHVVDYGHGRAGDVDMRGFGSGSQKEQGPLAALETVEDEEKFLYGDDIEEPTPPKKPEIPPGITHAKTYPHTEPPYQSNVGASYKERDYSGNPYQGMAASTGFTQGSTNPLYTGNDRSPFSAGDPSTFSGRDHAHAPHSAPDPTPSVHPKEENPPQDNTIENILKSIGFDFELSKRMQELARKREEGSKKPEKKPPERSFGIKESASFLGGGLDSVDLGSALERKKEPTNLTSVGYPDPIRKDDSAKYAGGRYTDQLDRKEEHGKYASSGYSDPNIQQPRNTYGEPESRYPNYGEGYLKDDDREPRDRDLRRSLEDRNLHERSRSYSPSPAPAMESFGELYGSRKPNYRRESSDDRSSRSSSSSSSRERSLSRDRDSPKNRRSSRDRSPPRNREGIERQRSDSSSGVAVPPKETNTAYVPGYQYAAPPPPGYGAAPPVYPAMGGPVPFGPPPGFSGPPPPPPHLQGPGFGYVHNPPWFAGGAVGGPPPPRFPNESEPWVRERERERQKQKKREDEEWLQAVEEFTRQTSKPRTVIPPKDEKKKRRDERSRSKDETSKDQKGKEKGKKDEKQEEKQKVKEKPSVKKTKKSLSPEEREKLIKEKEERQKRLKLLESELERLRKQQNELMRKKQRQRDGHKDPILVENTKLQEEIATQISHLRRSVEENSEVLNSEGDKQETEEKREVKIIKVEKQDKSEERIVKTIEIKPKKEKKKNEIEEKASNVFYEYFDPGNHWCRLCNHVSQDVSEVFNHLKSKKHQQSMDQNDGPWMSESVLNPPVRPKSAKVETVPMKGIEFLMPVDAYYCTLCKEFAGDATCTFEDHLKSNKHSDKYKKYLEENPFYERRLDLDRAAGTCNVTGKGNDNDANKDKDSNWTVVDDIKSQKPTSSTQDENEKETPNFSLNQSAKRSYRKRPRSPEHSSSVDRESPDRGRSRYRKSDYNPEREEEKRAKSRDSYERSVHQDRRKDSYSSRGYKKGDNRGDPSRSRSSRDDYYERILSASRRDEKDHPKSSNHNDDSNEKPAASGGSSQANDGQSKSKIEIKFKGKLPVKENVLTQVKKMPVVTAPKKPVLIGARPSALQKQKKDGHEDDSSKETQSLDMFLSIEGSGSEVKKAVPIKKEKELETAIAQAWGSKSKITTEDQKEREEDFKMLGIEADTMTPAAVPVPPPMLPSRGNKPLTSMASSSVEDVYSVFFGEGKQDSGQSKPDSGKDTGDDNASVGSDLSLEMGSDFEVLDEIDAE
ncbi:zinc finger protein 318 isoform X2 [Lingula anatina]|nr:zinc finger protein 318 isoform X2 [Lingula anatina]|eukprot:XP_013406635.1 zinc finger protein 318 isoform X2 [Lingula anatina]